MDARRLEQGQTVHRGLEDGGEVVPVLGQGVEHEVFTDAVHAPGLGLGLERADHHLARIRLVIGAFIRHPQHRQVTKAFNRLGNQVEVFAGVQGQRHARLSRQITAPHAAAVHHHIRCDMARPPGRLVIHPGDPAIGLGHAGDLGMLENLCAAHPRALGQRHGDVGGVALAVQRQRHRADHAVDVQMRIARLGLGRTDLVHFDVKDARDRRLAQQLFVPRCRQGDRYAADLPHPGFHPGFRRQLDVEIGRILGQPRHVRAAPKLTDQPRRVPGGAGR